MSLAVKLALGPVLVAQALLTRARLPRLPEAEGPRSGIVGRGPALRLLIAGDSSAAGVGVVHQRDALAVQVARQLSHAAAVCVHWRLLARTGLTTLGTLDLLREAGVGSAELAVVVTGVNDVIDQVPTPRAVAARDSLANWLRHAAGVRHVSFAPLPPVHAFPGLPQPLRWVAGTDARRHNQALQAWAATRDDVSCVPLDLPLDPSGMASDGFHPGAPVYRTIAASIAAHLVPFARPDRKADP